MRLIATLPLAALPLAALAACDSNVPPPLTGNLTDARGAHAGSFRAADNGSGDYGDAAASLHPDRNGAAIGNVPVAAPENAQ